MVLSKVYSPVVYNSLKDIREVHKLVTSEHIQGVGKIVIKCVQILNKGIFETKKGFFEPKMPLLKVENAINEPFRSKSAIFDPKK